MSMVWNITSHSDRAIAIESAKISNSLASEASRTAFLLRVLADDIPQSEVPLLVASAQKFVTQLKTVAQKNNLVRSKQVFSSLIPLQTVNDAGVGIDQIDEIAAAVEAVLGADGVDPEAVDELVERLTRVSERFANHAYEAGRVSIDA